MVIATIWKGYHTCAKNGLIIGSGEMYLLSVANVAGKDRQKSILGRFFITLAGVSAAGSQIIAEKYLTIACSRAMAGGLWAAYRITLIRGKSNKSNET